MAVTVLCTCLPSFLLYLSALPPPRVSSMSWDKILQQKTCMMCNDLVEFSVLLISLFKSNVLVYITSGYMIE